VSLKPTSLARLRVLLLTVVAFAAIAASFWLGRKSKSPDPANSHQDEKATGSAQTGSPGSMSPALNGPNASATRAESPVPAGSSSAAPPFPENTQPPKDSPLSGSFVGTLRLIIPVAGVKPEQLRDTFTEARSEGRAHDAIDIMAPGGTPVLAASDGEIVKLFQSERGGTTIYQLSPDKKLVFYYAHLQRYADGVTVGKFARQGEVIAYVGDTGNAGAGNYHLHFSVAVLSDPKRYWEGTNINPFPLLHR
jgi:murein DD-endopeptidase MepM/ murein hydrolase activator NlpD